MPRVVPSVALLVRTWNVFHGNAHPPTRHSYLREMITLATADDPDVVCLQEVPVWALEHLQAWSGMQLFPAVARHGLWPARLAGWLTRLDNGRFRSAVAGQANAVLVAGRHGASGLGVEQVNEQGRERRVCQAVRLEPATVIVNTHLSSAGSAQLVELERVLEFAERHAAAGERLVLAGDLNLVAPQLVGYSRPGPGIDHVLVRKADPGVPEVWPEERRRQNDVVLSDHPPVELRVA